MWDLVGNPEDRFSHNEAHIFDGKNTIQAANQIFVTVPVEKYFCCLLYHNTFVMTRLNFMSLVVRENRSSGFPASSVTNPAVQP